MKKLFFLLTLTLLLCGCCNVSISHKGHYDLALIDNSCWSLCNCLPLVSGNPDYPNSWHQSFLKDTATLQDNIKILDRTMTQGGYKGYANLVSFRSEEEILFFLIVRTTFHTSAELINHE